MKLARFRAISVALGLAASLVAGCSSPAATAPAPSGSAAVQNVTLDWGFWNQGDAGNKIWQGLADDVTKTYPNITVKLTSPPFADYFTKLQTQLAANEAPCIMSMQSLRLPAFAQAMEPLDDLLKSTDFKASDWNPASLKALQKDGKQYALPYGISTVVLYYNKDAFAAAGVAEPKNGWTVAEFEAAAKTITEKTGKKAFGESFSDLHMFSTLYAYNQARPVDDSGKLTLTDPKMQDAFTWYAGLATNQKVALVPASSSDVPWGEQQFVAGNVAMASDGSWNISTNATQAKFNVGVVTLPGKGTFSANSGFGISKNCKNKKEAMQAISVITGSAGQATAAAGGTFPARTAASQAFYDGLAKAVDAKTPGYSAQAKAAIEASSTNAVPFTPTTKWDQTTKAIAREFILAYTGTQDPKKTLENVQQSNG